MSYRVLRDDFGKYRVHEVGKTTLRADFIDMGLEYDIKAECQRVCRRLNGDSIFSAYAIISIEEAKLRHRSGDFTGLSKCPELWSAFAQFNARVDKYWTLNEMDKQINRLRNPNKY